MENIEEKLSKKDNNDCTNVVSGERSEQQAVGKDEAKPSAYSVYAKYGEWELVDSGISKEKDAIAWASEVSRKDEVATRVKYKDEIIWKSINK